jgi:phage/plasmid primase-like uncharacterized protein
VFDSGNRLAVATALREQHKGKVIVIARDDDHRLETNPRRTKALEAAAALSERAWRGSSTLLGCCFAGVLVTSV